jgi:hypothetical protein
LPFTRHADPGGGGTTSGQHETSQSTTRRDFLLLGLDRRPLTVGRLASQKGHLDLLDAIGRLSDSCGNVHYVWAGEGEKETSLRAAIGAAGLDGRVHLLGFRRDVAALLHAADLFVLPTRWEGCSRALLEAMSAGLPTVVSDASSNPEPRRVRAPRPAVSGRRPHPTGRSPRVRADPPRRNAPDGPDRQRARPTGTDS